MLGLKHYSCTLHNCAIFSMCYLVVLRVLTPMPPNTMILQEICECIDLISKYGYLFDSPQVGLGVVLVPYQMIPYILNGVVWYGVVLYM